MLTREEFKKDFIEYVSTSGRLLPVNANHLIERMTHYYQRILDGMKIDPGHTHPIYPSDICAPTPCPPEIAKCGYGAKAIKKEQEMASYASANIVTADSIERDQREFARSALRSQMETHKLALKHTFGLIDDDEPTTPAEFITRITDGKYTIDEKFLDYNLYGASSAAGYIRWRDPKTVEDKAGYTAARKELDAAYESAKLDVMLNGTDTLRAAVQSFADWKLS